MKNIPENTSVEVTIHDYKSVVELFRSRGITWGSVYAHDTSPFHYYRNDATAIITYKDGRLVHSYKPLFDGQSMSAADFLREYSEPEQSIWDSPKTKKMLVDFYKFTFPSAVPEWREERAAAFIKSKQAPPFLFVTADKTEIPLEKGFVYHVDGKEVSYNTALFASEHPELGPWFSTRELAQATMPILTTEDGVKATHYEQIVFSIVGDEVRENPAGVAVKRIEGTKHFSTRQAAEDHLVENWKGLSIKLIDLCINQGNREEIVRYVRQQLKLD